MKVYNTLTRKKEEFVKKEEEVRMYVCGITPYDLCHIGHARCYLVYDMITRYLRYKGYKILYVQNFTDIDDKIIEKAKEENITPKEVAEKYISCYFRDMDALGIERADIYPKVTEHISDIIKMIEGLLEKGYAYEAGGNVYFSVEKFPSYGKLSGRTLQEMEAGARVEIDENKKNPLDFVLWKKAKDGEPYWESPWGKGRPGWHIECSAMSLKYLGENFTIHGGAKELIFPHHENEIAQSESYTSSPFVQFWIHNGLVTVAGEKMSKSLGNFVTVEELLKKYEPNVIRMFLLSTHYQSPLNFSEEGLEQTKNGLQKIYNVLERIEEVLKPGFLIGENIENEEFYITIESLKTKFMEFMDDDFNSAGGIATIYEIVTLINKFLDRYELQLKNIHLLQLNHAKEVLLTLLSILGFKIELKKEIVEENLNNKIKILIEEYSEKLSLKIEEIPSKFEELMEKIIEIRAVARKNKNWEIADRIRDRLKELNIILQDTSSGTKWKKY